MIKIDTTLTSKEIEFIKTRHQSKQMLFVILFKYYQQHYDFDLDLSKVPQTTIKKLALKLGIAPKLNAVSNRTYGNYYALIRQYFRTAYTTKAHYKLLTDWIKSELLPKYHISSADILPMATAHLKYLGVEPISHKIMTRLIRFAVKEFEQELFSRLHSTLSNEQEAKLNGLLLSYDASISWLGLVHKDFTNPALETVLRLIEQLTILNDIDFNIECIASLPQKSIDYYADSFTRFKPSHLKTMNDQNRCARMILYLYNRKGQITDRIIDVFNRISRNIIHKSEKRVVTRLISQVKRVYGKDTILFHIAEACVADPDEKIRDKIFPIANEDKLTSIIDEYKKKGPRYQSLLHQQVRSSYASYYRRMIKPFLETLTFRSNNPEHQPILDGLSLIVRYFDCQKKYFPEDEIIPLDFLPQKWRRRITDPESGKIKRICYEVYLLKRLSDRIRCREIWIEGAYKHRNPDEDLPQDFENDKADFFTRLSLPISEDEFVDQLQNELTNALTLLNNNIPKNPKVSISNRKNGRIILTPLSALPESPNVATIKKHLQDKWQNINLIDVLKELELNTGFTQDFVSYGEKIYLKPKEISERVLLAIYGFGINVGLKPMCAGNPHITYSQLKHVKNYLLTADNLRHAITKVANLLFKIRNPAVWGENPIAVAGDSTQFAAYFQNLISEHHNRYGGRGVMVYWHVEKNATCIHSQLKSVSSSEVASMIEGVLRHCTEMSVEKSYVDTHGQSEIGFAFSHLLGFELLPRLANLNKQKLAQCQLGDYKKYTNLQNILADRINWQLIKEQYHQMVKYTAAMKDGHADPESILRRFTRNNLKHPVYLALSQLGKVIKTIFICNYLMDEALRHEIQGGLNVVECWNGVSKFIFYGRTGEITSNHDKAQELSVLSLHLLQLAMVYVNTLMIQQVLIEQNMIGRLTSEDKRALTPLIYEHINPYGLFPLDLTCRIPHITYLKAA
jgi:TnpA family transposase